MSIKTRWIIKNIIKISILSLILTLWFLIVNNFVWAWKIDIKKEEKSNNIKYKNIAIKPIANVWVAITSNIWIWVKKTQKISSQSIDNKIFKAEDFYKNSDKIKKQLIIKNMLFIKEYHNVLKMNINEELKKSKNREKTLKNIIKQLQIRLQNANSNITNLNKQIEILLWEYNNITTQIETLKKSLEIDFAKSNSQKVFKTVDDYYDLKYKQTNLKINLIFLWEFLKRYNVLNSYNKKILDTIVNNKDIISKNSFVVIPNSTNNMLKNFNLILSEEEYKTKIQK